MDTDEERRKAYAAEVVLWPIVRGLDDLAVVSLTPPSLEEVTEARNLYRQRGEQLHALILSLNALDAIMTDLLSGGYPALPTVAIRSDVAAEFEEEKTDIAAAFGVFTIRPEANKIVFGAPVIEDKPTPIS